MGFNFPNTPTIGDLYPTPALPGVPQYRWDGAVWTTTTYDPLSWVQRAGDTMTGALNVVTPPTLAAHAASKAYVDAYAVAAAPFDALAYNGMQVNGNFDVSQELGVAGGVGNLRSFADGWKCEYSGTMVVQSGLGTTGDPSKSYQAYANTVTAAPSLGSGDFTAITQNIEGYRIARLSWGTPSARPVTFGFISNHSRAGLYCLSLRNADASRGYVSTYTQNVAGVPEWKTITIPGCTDGVWNSTNGVGIRVMLMVAAGTAYNAPAANTWGTAYASVAGQVNNVQAVNDITRFMSFIMVPGIYAPTAAQSPLIMRPYDQELQICKRYLYVFADATKYPGHSIGLGQYYVPTQIDIHIQFPVEMRTTPTLKTVGTDTTSFIILRGVGGSENFGGLLATSQSNLGAIIYSFANGTGVAGDCWWVTTNNSTVKAYFDARL